MAVKVEFFKFVEGLEIPMNTRLGLEILQDYTCLNALNELVSGALIREKLMKDKEQRDKRRSFTLFNDAFGFEQKGEPSRIIKLKK